MTRDDRGIGKTTQLFEHAVDLLGELPETSNVFITGAHNTWLNELRGRVKDSGLEGIVILSPEQIMMGALRGRRGLLLIDDWADLTWKQRDVLTQEQRVLRR